MLNPSYSPRQESVYTPEMAPEQVQQPETVQPRYVLPSYGSVMQPQIKFADMDPEIKLQRLKAEARAKNESKRRQIDSSVTPIIQKDMEEAAAHTRQLQAELERTRQALEQPYQRPQMSMGDMIAAGISGLLGGAQGFNQAAGGAYQRLDQDYERNFQLQRQNAQIDFEMAQSEVEQSRRRMEALRNAYLESLQAGDNYERQLVLKEMQAEEDRQAAAEDHARKMELEAKKGDLRISLEQAKREGKLDPAKVSFWKATMEGTDPEGRAVVLFNAMKNLGLGEPPVELLEAVQQMNIDEQLKDAKRQTEDETRQGKVDALLAKNQLTKDQAEYVRTKTRYYPEYLQVALAGRQIQMFNALGRMNDVNFDNQIKAWDQKTSPEIAGHVKRVEKLTAEMDDIRKQMSETTDEDVREKLTVELNNKSRERAKIRKRIEDLNATMPGYTPFEITPEMVPNGLPPVGGPPIALPNGTLNGPPRSVVGGKLVTPPKSQGSKPPKSDPMKGIKVKGISKVKK